MTRRKKLLAMSAILGMVIGLGLTAAVGGGLYYIYQEQADLFSTSAQIEVRNLNALRSGDTLTITANVKNVGSTALTDVYLFEARTGDAFSITTSDPSGHVVVSSGDYDAETDVGAASGDYDTLNELCGLNGASTTCDNDHGRIAFSGISFGTGVANSYPVASSSLDGGGTTAIRLVVDLPDTAADVLAGSGEISETVTITDRLTLQLGVSSGDDDFLSDIYNTRIRPG